jgi:hypothetical protein
VTSAAVALGAPRFNAVPAPPAVAPLTGLLDQLRDVVTLLPRSLYVARPAARVSGSVGEHVRHCLDHVASLTDSIEGEPLSYDRRRRGTTVEIDPTTAVSEIERLLARLERLPGTAVERSLTLTVLIDPHAPPVVMRSTFDRELAFVLLHTVHHCALIAVLLEWQGWRVPHDFGVAPATREARHVARS